MKAAIPAHMERWLGVTPKAKPSTITNKRKRDQEYDANKRQRKYLPSWATGRSWLRYDDKENQMFCLVCHANEHGKAETGPFTSGTFSFQITSVKAHEDNSCHKRETEAVEAASKGTMQSQAGQMLSNMNRALLEKMKLKFRTVHAIVKHDRPFTDYTWQCVLDEKKGLVLGTDYRSDKSAAEFAHHIAEVSLNFFFKLFSERYCQINVIER